MGCMFSLPVYGLHVLVTCLWAACSHYLLMGCMFSLPAYGLHVVVITIMYYDHAQLHVKPTRDDPIHTTNHTQP